VQQCMYVNKDFKICDICDLQKRLTQTWADFEQNVIEDAIDQWRDRVRSCVRAAKPRSRLAPSSLIARHFSPSIAGPPWLFYPPQTVV